MIHLINIILAVGLLLAFVFRDRRQRVVAVALSVTGLIVGCYLAEGVLTILAIDPGHRAAWWHDVAFDRRSKAQVVDDLQGQGRDAQPNVIPSGFVPMDGLVAEHGGRILPLAGISGSDIVFCNEAGPWLTYVADEHGFRNPAGCHRPDEVDLVLLGDSFVQGQCVATGEDIAGRLRERGYRVVNLGIAGSGPLIQLAALTEYATRLRPALVVWTVYEGNDAHELVRERGSAILMGYLEPGFSQNLASRQLEIDGALRRYVRARLKLQLARPAADTAGRFDRFLQLRQLEQRLIQGFGRKPWPSQTKAFDRLIDRVLGEARRRVEAWGGRFYLLYLPETGKTPGREGIRRRTLRRVAELGISLIDASATLSDHPDRDSLYPLRLRHGRHFNGEGYRLIAGIVAARLPAARDLRRSAAGDRRSRHQGARAL